MQALLPLKNLSFLLHPVQENHIMSTPGFHGHYKQYHRPRSMDTVFSYVEDQKTGTQSSCDPCQERVLLINITLSSESNTQNGNCFTSMQSTCSSEFRWKTFQWRRPQPQLNETAIIIILGAWIVQSTNADDLLGQDVLPLPCLTCIAISDVLITIQCSRE